jgi:hypothetical protein
VKAPTFPNLDGLVGLARTSGVDIRPTLLRVLTDLYVQKPAHSIEEERHYTELALRLIDAVDPPVRVTVAWKLASYSAAPLAIAERLARDIIDVATPILKYSQVLSKRDLLTIAIELGAAHEAVIATREEFAPAPPAPRDDADIAPAPAVELTEIFFTAGGDERRLILLNLDLGLPSKTPPIAGAHAREAVRRLEMAALQRHHDECVDSLESALGLSAPFARRMIEDPSGEPIVVAAKALGMSSAVLQRIVLFLNPVVGQSVQRVYDLAQLYDEITLNAALRLLGIWREVCPRTQRPGSHQPYHWVDEESGPRLGPMLHRAAVNREEERRRDRA